MSCPSASRQRTSNAPSAGLSSATRSRISRLRGDTFSCPGFGHKQSLCEERWGGAEMGRAVLDSQKRKASWKFLQAALRLVGGRWELLVLCRLEKRFRREPFSIRFLFATIPSWL